MIINIISILLFLIILAIGRYVYIYNGFLSYKEKANENLRIIYEDNNSFSFKEIKKNTTKSLKRRANKVRKIQSFLLFINKNYYVFSFPGFLITTALVFIYAFIFTKSEWIYKFIKSIVDNINNLLPVDLYGWVLSHNELLFEIAKYANSSIGLILSVSLTIYLFTYRLRRTISVSSNIVLQNNTPVFTLLLFTFLYGQLFFMMNDSGELFIKRALNLHLFLWFFLFLFSMKYGLSTTIPNMLKSVHFAEILKSIKSNITLTIEVLSRTEAYNNQIYEHLIHSISSIYQTLIISIESNSDNEFKKYYKEWQSFLVEFKSGNKVSYLNSYVPIEILKEIEEKDKVNNNHSHFENLYTTFLDNHVNLITALYENNKYDEALVCIQDFSNLEPPLKYNGAYEIYFKKMKLLINITEDKPDQFLKTTLQVLNNFSINSISKNYGIVIYKDLILKSVSKNEVS